MKPFGQKSTIKQDVLTLASSCPIHEERQTIRQKNVQDHMITLRYGRRCVKLLERPEQYGYGEKLLMILTTKNKPAGEIVEAYLVRWRVEETIRFAKQAFDMGNIRLLTYKRLQNKYALIMVFLSY